MKKCVLVLRSGKMISFKSDHAPIRRGKFVAKYFHDGVIYYHLEDK